MSKYIGVFICGVVMCFSSTMLAAQSYHIYRPVPDLSVSKEEQVSRNPVLEVTLAPVLLSGEITDTDRNLISPFLIGGRIGILGRVTEYIATGLEYEQVVDQTQKVPYVSHIKRQEMNWVAKWNITPQTSPAIYLIGGIGYAKQSSMLELQHQHLKASSNVWILGVGGKIIIGKSFGILGEYRLCYDGHPWRNFIFTAPALRQNISVGIFFQY